MGVVVWELLLMWKVPFKILSFAQGRKNCATSYVDRRTRPHNTLVFEWFFFIKFIRNKETIYFFRKEDAQRLIKRKIINLILTMNKAGC